MAKQDHDGGDGGALAGMPNLEGMDMESIQKMMEEAMNDPSFAAMNANMAEAMEQLGNMSPEELQAQMMEGLQQLTSGDIMDSVLGKKDEVLETLAAQGLVPQEKIAEYRANPEKVRMNQSVRDTKEIRCDVCASWRIVLSFCHGTSSIAHLISFAPLEVRGRDERRLQPDAEGI